MEMGNASFAEARQHVGKQPTAFIWATMPILYSYHTVYIYSIQRVAHSLHSAHLRRVDQFTG